MPAQMTAWLQQLDATGDRRSIFLRCYAWATCNLMAALESDEIRDPDWTLSLATLLGDYYFATLGSAQPFHSVCPPAWEVAHRLGSEPQTPHDDAVLLGLNAQVNHDLPLTLATLLERDWPMPSARLGRRRQDFLSFVDVIAEATPTPGADWVLPRIVRGWSTDVWETALALLTAGDAAWRSAICEDIEHAALKRAHIIACEAGMREHLVALPSSALHRAFDRHRAGSCRCGIAAARCDSWSTVAATS